MGFAVAAEAARRGAKVTLIAGPTTVEPPAATEIVRVRSAARHARRRHGADGRRGRGRHGRCGGRLHAGDRRGASEDRKIDKGDAALTLVLERTPDILAELGARRGGSSAPVLVGFAAQTGDPMPAARRKLASKRVDLIVANDVTAPGAGFDVPTNQVTLVSADAADALPLQSKVEVARAILNRVEQLIIRQPAAVAPR